MNQDIKIGAMLEVPVTCLGANFKTLIEMLTVNNPEAKKQAFFGNKFSQNTVDKKLAFYDLNKANRSILLPRNIDRKFFPNTGNVIYNTSGGTEIGTGYKAGSFKLRPHQQEYFSNQVLPCISNIIYNNNIQNNLIPIDLLLNAECGSGKTAMALYLSSYYGCTSLVTVTTKKIGNQFKDTVKALFPDWSVGWAEDGKKYDITLATYSLLSKPNYGAKFFDQFGHLILDEYHRAGADSYQIILAKAGCRYRTTLTATFRRKDGLHKILQHHIGTILEMPRTSRKARIVPLHTGVELNEIEFRNVERTQIKTVSEEDLKLTEKQFEKLARLEEFTEVAVKDGKTRFELSRGMVKSITLDEVVVHCGISYKEISFNPSKVTFHKLGTIAMAIVDNEIVEMQNRNDIILSLIKDSVKLGRKVLVLSKRKNLLYKLQYRLTRYGVNSGVVVSEKAKDYKDYCKKIGRTLDENRDYVFNEADVILGIDKLAEEGMDVPAFDTIIYVHPMSDIEQSIGRITRELENKKYSLAYYLLDNISPYQKMWNKKDGAKNMFESLGHEVESEINFKQYKELIENGSI